jgi:hypothetical protein
MADEVEVDPRCDLRYYTMVLQGFDDLGVPVRFSRLDGPEGHGMAVRSGDRRIWIAANDQAELELNAAAWADTVWKVNLDPATEYAPHVGPIGPLFGIQAWPLPAGYRLVVPLGRRGVQPRHALAQLRFQGLTRLPMTAYSPGASEPTFLFLRARAWRGKHSDANRDRELFMDAVSPLCLETSMQLADDRISLADYLTEMRRSVVAFNSPAVHDCLGWKLGEFLALGKAIVSTSLGRDLPDPLVHGEHIHYVERDRDSIREAVERIAGDDAYRRQLERGARAWFDRNLRPEVVAARVLGR